MRFENEGSLELVAAPHAAAGELGIEIAVAVTDAGGYLTAFERADGAPFLSAAVAINKAWTTASHSVATHDWSRYVADPKGSSGDIRIE